MLMLRELLFLASMLFTDISKVRRLRLKPMTHFPFRGYLLLMWCGIIVFRRENRSRIVELMRSGEWGELLRHETVHLEQARRCGGWKHFYLSYLWQWLRCKPWRKPYKKAYYDNPYEKEAYGN